jgi:hypothetical protein
MWNGYANWEGKAAGLSSPDDVRIVRSAHERAAWHESGLTVFFLKPGWTNIPPLEQHAKFAHCLQHILATAERAKPGSGFPVSVHGKIEQIYP